MPTVTTEVHPDVKEWIEERTEMLATTQKVLVESMILYCVKDNESVREWQEWFLRANLDDWENPFDSEPVDDEDLDFLEAIDTSNLPTDDPDHAEAIEESWEDTPKTLEEMMEDIESL